MLLWYVSLLHIALRLLVLTSLVAAASYLVCDLSYGASAACSVDMAVEGLAFGGVVAPSRSDWALALVEVVVLSVVVRGGDTRETL
ncbi:hypothetical protein M408DRAFT_334422, partial [Serendipita vermifera MAFF 305830]